VRTKGTEVLPSQLAQSNHLASEVAVLVDEESGEVPVGVVLDAVGGHNLEELQRRWGCGVEVG